MAGEVTQVDAAPDTTVGEFKQRVLVTLFGDELSRNLSLVELFLGDEQQSDNAVNSAYADAPVLAVLMMMRSARCLRKDETDN